MPDTESNPFTFHDTLPVGPLKILAMDNCKQLGEEVNQFILQFRRNDTEELKKRKEMSLEFNGYDRDTYLLKAHCPRFGTGEAKGVIEESVRGTDLFILSDVTNYSLTYSIFGQENHMSPDDHFQDLKRLISASVANAHRVNVVMPFLYEGRQHRRARRESLDSATALQELVEMGVSDIITFDAHDPGIQNAIPLNGFDNYTPPYQFIKAIFQKDKNLRIDKDHLIVISPDEGAMSRAVYFANNLGVDMGMFYKRRDYSKVVGGKNPIVAHEYLGTALENKTVIIMDDMISSGDSMLDTSRELKRMGAGKVIICCTYGLFTEGFERFDKAYSRGYFDYVVTTNLNYRSPELFEKPWYIEANMSKFVAAIINTLNHDVSTDEITDPAARIQRLITRYNNSIRDEFEQLTLNL